MYTRLVWNSEIHRLQSAGIKAVHGGWLKQLLFYIFSFLFFSFFCFFFVFFLFLFFLSFFETGDYSMAQGERVGLELTV